MSSCDQTTNIFKYPSSGADFYSIYPQQPSPLPYMPHLHQPHHPQQSMQLCEIVYTQVSTPNGMALTPFLNPVNTPMNGQVFHPAPSPAPSSQGSMQRDANSVKALELRQVSANFGTINGLPADQWRTMSDKEREDFLKEKRRKEAFKSALCKAFQQSGECKYGGECRFAHGNEELRLPKYNHPKYKTVLCRSFALTGFCPYGSRCQFIHEKYQGPVPEGYIASVENMPSPKPKRQMKNNFDGVQFSGEGQGKSKRVFYGAKNCAEIREGKKKLLAGNEMNYFSDLSETLGKIFDDRKFYSQSCKPRIQLEEDH